jgi:hypothetical protein
LKLADLNPITHIGNWMDKATFPKDEPTSTAVAPADGTTVITDERGREAEIVSGTFVPDIPINASSYNNAHKHTEHLRKTIASFNEDKMTPLKWIIVTFFTFLSYTAPILIALVVGMAIGEAWAGPFDIKKPWTVYSYSISVTLELMLPALGYAVTVILKQAFNDRSKVGLLVSLALLFVALAVGNSFAQMFLIEGHVKLAANDTAGHISMYFRSFTPMIVDIIATIFLGVVTVKNLQKFLKDKQQEAMAIRSGAEAEIAVDEAFQSADRRRREAEAEQRRKDEQLDTMQEFYRIQNQKLIQDARSKLLDEGPSDRGGRYGGW